MMKEIFIITILLDFLLCFHCFSLFWLLNRENNRLMLCIDVFQWDVSLKGDHANIVWHLDNILPNFSSILDSKLVSNLTLLQKQMWLHYVDRMNSFCTFSRFGWFPFYRNVFVVCHRFLVCFHKCTSVYKFYPNGHHYISIKQFWKINGPNQ